MKLNVDLKNCYGISELNHCFDFANSSVYAIYAPNGFMKTSMSKTFDDYAKGRDSSDLIFPDRVTTRVLTDNAATAIAADSIFVIEPYNQEFSSERTSLLLVNATIKQQYDDALKQISEKLSALLGKLKQLSGITGRTITPETEILKVFGSKSVADLLESLEQSVAQTQPSKLADLVARRPGRAPPPRPARAGGRGTPSRRPGDRTCGRTPNAGAAGAGLPRRTCAHRPSARWP